MTNRIRVAGDTYPETVNIKVNGTPVNLSGYTVQLQYEEVQPTGDVLAITIEGVISPRLTGLVKFHPRELYTTNTSNSAPYIGMAVVGEHSYRIVRSKVAHEKDVAGTLVIVDREYITYDSGNTAHDGLQLYREYTELMTHETGKLIINSVTGDTISNTATIIREV